MTETDSIRWTYRAARTGSGGEDLFSHGRRTWNAEAQSVADTVAAQVRVMHSYSGPLDVWVWPSRQDEHYRDPVPDDADRFEYGEGLDPVASDLKRVLGPRRRSTDGA